MDGFRLGVHLADRSGRRSEERDREFRGMLATAEVPSIRFHELRHTAATLLLSQGVDPRTIMETLGHSQISLTMNTYSHVLPALQAEASAKMETVELFGEVVSREGIEPSTRRLRVCCSAN